MDTADLVFRKFNYPNLSTDLNNNYYIHCFYFFSKIVFLDFCSCISYNYTIR